ncbi:MAG: hypothetical protein Q7O66_03655, partial [Dehalococcoidia bacterium]|nr:hypothetical protein [Dehalococcoidia bacterium]
MTSIEALQKKYPNIPQEVVVKWEVLSRGIRDTEDLNKTAAWMRRDNWGTYQSYDQDVTLEEVVGKKSNRVKPGYMLRSTKFYMGNGVGSDIQLNTKSPYEIRELGDGRFGLFEGDERVDVNIYFPLKPERDEGVTSKGTAVGDLVPVNRRCFGIIPVRYCEYFATGDQCKFCNFNPAQI